jgi:hypothetical protein
MPSRPPVAAITTQEIERTRSRLNHLSEREFTIPFLIPYFQRIGYDVVDVHAKGEERHRLDLLLIRRLSDGSIAVVHGVQVKKEDYDTFSDVRDAITPYLDFVFGSPHTVDGEQHFIQRFYWITSGRIQPAAERGFTELKNTIWRKDIRLWSGSVFIRDVHKRGWSFLIEELHEIQLRTAKQQHVNDREGVFAAYCAYLSALWHLRDETRDNDAARACLQEAARLVDSDERKALYYFRSLRTYYGILDDLLSRFPTLQVADLGLLNGTSSGDEVRECVQAQYPGWGEHFLHVMTFLLDQFDLLEERYLDPRSGLSSLQVCRLLLRSGRSPAIGSLESSHLQASRITRRLKAIRQEMEFYGKRMMELKRPPHFASLDDECSICTGTGVACLALANQRDSSKPAVEWLASLRKQRFTCYEDEPGEQALHNTATVLDGFCSFEYGAASRLTNLALAVLLGPVDLDSPGLPNEWMRYRNIHRYEVCTYIFSAFLVLSLSGYSFKRKDLKVLRHTLRTFSAELIDEARHGDMLHVEKPAKLYAVRENVGSLALAVLLGTEDETADEAVELLLRDALRHFHRRSRVVLANRRHGNDLFSQHLMDSDVDRMRRMTEGWMQFWEVFHLCRENGRDLSSLLPNLQIA